MKPTKAITVDIPLKLYDELKKKNINIDKVVNSALQKSIKVANYEEELKKGYQEMGEINLGLAEMCLEADNEALLKGESYLTECE